MAKRKLSVTIDSDLVDLVDQLAAKDGLNRSECIEHLLEESVGMDGSGRVEFWRLIGPPLQVQGWMHQADMFNDIAPEDGPVELVLRVTRKQWDDYMAKHGVKQNKRGMRRE